MDLSQLFNVEDLQSEKDPQTMKTRWSGLVKGPGGIAVPFSMMGSKPNLFRAAKEAGLKLDVFYVENGAVVEKEIDLSELYKLKINVGVKCCNRQLGLHRSGSR